MLRPITAVAAALLLAIGARAGFQGSVPVGWLGAGDWQLREVAGEAHLVESPYEQPPVVHGVPKPRTGRGHRWAVSAPTIKADSGRLLGYDTKGRDPTVRLVTDGKDKAASTRWAFEVVSRIVAERSKKERDFKEGPTGMTFRAMAAEGPHKGWYLAVKDGGKGPDGKGRRRLVLVRAKKDATVFKYIGEYLFPDHR